MIILVDNKTKLPYVVISTYESEDPRYDFEYEAIQLNAMRFTDADIVFLNDTKENPRYEEKYLSTMVLETMEFTRVRGNILRKRIRSFEVCRRK